MSDSWHEGVKNKNRDEIIAAGKELFLKYNFVNVNIKDVCNLAGVSRVTFYKHFKSLDELIFEVQMDILNSMTDYIMARDNSKVSGIERLRLVLYAWINFAKENSRAMKFIILFDLYYEEYNPNEELKLKFKNFINRENHEDFLNSSIIAGIKDKSLKEDLEPAETGCYIFQTIMGVLQRMSYTTTPADYINITFDDIAASVVDMIINYVKAA